MRGNLLVQKLGGVLYRAQLNVAGTAVTSTQTLANPVGLDVVTGPGGAILTIDYDGGLIKVLRPNDAGAPSVVAYDIFPWRGRPDGTTPFVIGGAGFGTAANTSVTIGGLAATLTSVSPTRIKGLIPPQANPTSDLVDVVVQSAGQSSTITRGFRYLVPSGSGRGTWKTGPVMPQVTQKVAGGVINGVMYMVSGDIADTFAYDLATQTWKTLPARPFVGAHHAAEVISNKLYLFGGLNGAEGRVQIYDPVTNAWTQGALAPVASGSAATALINGLVYMAGGIAGGNTFTTDAAAVYNPATDTWSTIANMPLPRNYTAAGTDGQRLFIFGGRGPGSGDTDVVAEGFPDVQIYDPTTDMWECSCTPGSLVPPLPQNRGGMGKAAFHRGEFYVIGGETISSGTGQVTGNVYNRVDVYNPATRSWRMDAPLPTARHGIFPLAYDGQVFVAGGGDTSGSSSSNVLDILAH
jgi:N-acetylneuraminic acid mutarotase